MVFKGCILGSACHFWDPYLNSTTVLFHIDIVSKGLTILINVTFPCWLLHCRCYDVMN